MSQLVEPTEHIKCLYHTGPVTALIVVNKNIIAGCGDYLYLYAADSTQCLQRISVLPCTRIHGIRSATNDVYCVFGEKKACIVTKDIDGLKNTGKKVQLKDLIWDATFLTNQESRNNQVVFALAHNTIVRWDSDCEQILDIVQCEENSILYSARFITTNWEKMILAAGTVFNHVLLWSPMTTKNSSGHSPVMHTFKGHQGVIFSIRYNNQRHQICSVSDDRSIRIWQLTFPKKVAMVTTDLELTDWEQCQSSPLLVLYGHTARVWDINLLSDVMISVGEDSLCCVWNYNGDLIQKFKGHKGKSIWSLATDEQEKFFVTGGGDTSIRFWKLHGTENQSQSKIIYQSLPFPDKDDFVRVVSFWRTDFVLGMTNEGSMLIHSLTNGTSSVVFTDVNFRSYTVMCVSHLIVLGNIKGTVRLICAKETETQQDMKFMWSDYDMYSGKVFSIHWLSESLIVTTGPDGDIHCYKIEVEGTDVPELSLIQKFTLPYCKQRWVSAAALTADGKSLICGDRDGTIHVYSWGGQEDHSLDPVESFWKIHGKTGVTDICAADDIIYTSGRDGHYRTFKVENDQLILLNSNRVSKGFDWLDKLVLQPDGDIYIYGFQSDSFILFSIYNNQRLVQIPCGGGHRTWDCQIAEDKVQFVFLKMREVVFCKTDLLTNQIILKESLHGRETTCVKRFYRYMSENNRPVDTVVTCSEDTTILVSNLTYNDNGVLTLSRLHAFRDHISNVKCMTRCVSFTAGSHLVFTGGARAQLLITRISFENDIKCCDLKSSFQTLKSCHLGEEWLTKKQKKLKSLRSNPETRIMDLCVMPFKEILADSPDHLYVLASACSDAFVRFYVFDEKFCILTPLCDSMYHDHCVLKILHTFISTPDAKYSIFLSAGTDGRIAFWDISKQISVFLTMYQSVEHSTDFHGLYNLSKLILICRSEGESKKDADIIQTSQDSELSNQVELDKSNKALNIDNSHLHLHRKNNEDEKSTCIGQKYSDKNSLVNFEEDDLIIEPLLVIKCHQSGVNGMDVMDFLDGRILVASGGDDNALTVSILSRQHNKIYLVYQCQELSAHSAQITGVHIFSQTKIMTVSVDQRMCLWEVSHTDFKPQISQCWSKFVNVPDISHMEVWQDDDRIRVGVCGEGLCIFEIEKNKI